MKKIVALMIAILMSASVLTACGKSQKDSRILARSWMGTRKLHWQVRGRTRSVSAPQWM